MTEWDMFLLKEFSELKEDEEMVTVIRELTPGRTKYRSTYARIVVSKDHNKYPERLWVRLGRGQLVESPCSMKIIEQIVVVPKGI